MDYSLSWYQISKKDPYLSLSSAAKFRPILLFLLLSIFSIIMSTSKSSFRLTLVVSNIKNHVPITLEMENVQYSTWAELFKIHALSHRVINHIIPLTQGKEKLLQIEEEKEL